MIQKESINKKEETNNWVCIGKGLLIAVILTIVLLLIFSILLTYTSIQETTIAPVVVTISGLSILAGSSIGMIHISKNGMVYGAIVGCLYVLTLYLLSSFLGNSFTLNSVAILFIIVGIVTGAIGGIIGVNRK